MSATLAINDVDASCWIVSPITISWGRAASPGSQPDAATLTATLITTDADGHPPPVMVGSRITAAITHVFWTGYLRFVGTVTDVAIELANTNRRVVTIMAADPIANLSALVIGDEPWPAETADWRLYRIEMAVLAKYAGDPGAEAMRGIHFWSTQTNPGLVGVQVNPVDIDARSVLDVLTEFCQATDSWMQMNPALFAEDIWGQLTIEPNRWLSAADPWIVDSCDIPIEGLRQATNRGQIVNQIRVGYGVPAEGAEQSSVVAIDAGSVADYLPRAEYLGTILADSVAAQDLADRLIVAYAQPVAVVDGLTLTITFAGNESADDWFSLRDQITNRPIQIEAPDGTTHVWIAQGGTDEIHHDRVIRTYELGDSPAWVMPLSWDEAPDGMPWDSADPDLRWDDVRDSWPTVTA